MRQRVASAPPALAVTGKGVSESATQSRFAKVSQTAAAGSAAEEKFTEAHKRPLLAKKGVPNGRSSGQQGRAPVRESKSITTTVTTVGLCHGAERQHALHSLQPSPSTALEVSLVQNLKKQIACLEAQLHVMKQQQDTMTRTHRHSNASNHVESARAADTAAAARLISVELTLPHAERIRHTDAVAPSVNTTESDDVAVARMREIPAAYQTERSVLLHNLESLTKDVEGLQSLVLHLGRERDLMAAEVVDFRAALRETKVENESMAAECAATHRLLEKEQALRRVAEESVRQCTTAASSHRSSLTVADAYSQRDYYKLQAERTAEALTLAKAKTHALSDALQREYDAAKTLEVQLCGALDRISQMKRREDELARYYQQLSGRFVTVSATLRHVLDVAPKGILKQQRVPSPERAPAGQPQAADMTMDELRDTLDAWHREAAVEAAKAQQRTETITGDALALLEMATETMTTVTSGLGNGLPANGDEAAATAPTRCAAARAMVGSEESATDDDALPVAQPFEELPRSSSWEAVTPVTHLLPAVPTPTAGAGNAAPSTCSDEKGFKGLVVDAALPVQLYEVSDAAAMPLPPSAAPQKILATLKTPMLNPAAVDHAAEVREVAQSPSDEKSITEHVAFDSAAPLTSEQTAEMTAEKSAAAGTAVGTVVGIAVGAPSFSGDALAVPPAAHVASNPGSVPVISSTPPPQGSEDTRPSHPRPPLTSTATAAPAEPPAPTPEGDAGNEKGVLSPPPVSAVPHPLPPNLVPVPLPSAPLPLPPGAVPVSVPPAPPVPPSLEQQLQLLNARIDAQEAALTEMVRSRGGLVRSTDTQPSNSGAWCGEDGKC
ncbi:hypothetical protein LMJF_28_1040 [Leishmania major strain Friedlin]|uniref:Uncharacterized protein n=1 Tax=Leishmania major TaxID=5664 RepID=Q4Q8G3_LEIMA|nr:hypothetical protein LMJF_28_1040 [Leishmania major strain Friedlin]CAG9577210.1 hypothetical_protein_-_conserved [Leishmania major strain Friedlin]CAJ05260.1 hypothetical protein LMJF_28_1040 [Leishmania major strain Friedlin]|eukprot:XP_001684385.1 hypothetical protein LMJF_28_1040 [Leishmania major strain Friedlin]